MPYSLSDRVLFGLLATEGREYRALMAALVRVEADPVGSCDGAATRRNGQVLYFTFVGRFQLYYRIERSGRVFFVEVLARR